MTSCTANLSSVMRMAVSNCGAITRRRTKRWSSLDTDVLPSCGNGACTGRGVGWIDAHLLASATYWATETVDNRPSADDASDETGNRLCVMDSGRERVQTHE